MEIDLKKTPLIELSMRLNEIEKIKQDLDLEYLKICKELYRRIPNLKDNAKVLRKDYNEKRIEENKEKN